MREATDEEIEEHRRLTSSFLSWESSISNDSENKENKFARSMCLFISVKMSTIELNCILPKWHKPISHMETVTKLYEGKKLLK
jgi:hypothetical protein